MDEENVLKRVITRKCPYCGTEHEIKTGPQNLKNLFRKPTWNEWFLLIMLLFCIGLGILYFQETKTCREYINNIDQVCANLNVTIISPYSQYMNSSPAIIIIDKNNSRMLKAQLEEMIDKINSISLLPNGEREME